MKTCTLCDESKPREDFRKNKSQKDGLHQHCILCARQYMKDRYHRLRAEYTEMLGGECVRCGSIENLHFDHIDPEDKTLTVGQLLNHSKEKVLAELKKCQLLCRTCHELKSKEEGDTMRGREPAKHGSKQMYVFHGCRCETCVTEHKRYAREYTRAWRKKNGRSKETGKGRWPKETSDGVA